MLPHGDKVINCWIPCFVLDEKEAYMAIFLVGEDVKVLIFVVKDNLCYTEDIEQLVNINVVILLQVHPETVVE